VARTPKVCTTIASGVLTVVDIPVGSEIIGVSVLCLTSNGSGSMTVKTNAGSPVAISNAIACVTADVIAYAGTIDSTYQVVGADGIQIVGNGAADHGKVYITYL
jgi:hypothetical protein